MKKIFTLFAALAMVMSMSAATKTVYFKTQEWWHKDGAASAAYYWGTGGNANAWPGTRMTKVSGETNMWSIDIDTDKYQNIIFTRVNGSGNVEFWGAKTVDLSIDNANFFTLSTTEVWGDPGAAGNWSVYAPDAPKSYKDITITVVANATPKIHYWEGGDKMVGSDWENKPEMVATGEENTYSYTIKDVDEATGVRYLIVVGELQSADKQAFENVTVNFKDLLPQVAVMGVTGWTGDKMTVADDYLSASVTLTLEAAKDYEIKLTVDGGWFGSKAIAITKENNSASFAENGEGNGKLTTDLAGDYVFTYTYATKTLTVAYPVSVTATAENGTVEGAGTYTHGTEVTLTATAAEGYEFVNWTENEVEVSTDAEYTFEVLADRALVANFKKSVVTHDFYVEDVTVTEGQWSIDLAGSWNEQAFVLRLWQDNTQGFGTYAANAETGYSAALGVKELTPTAEGYYMQDPMNENAFIFQGTMTDGADIYEVYLKGALASESETGEMEAKTEVAFSCDADGVWGIEAFADDYSWGLMLEVVPNLETGEYVATGYYVTDIEAGVMEEVAGTGMLYFDDFSGCQVFKGNLTTESGNIYPTLYASSLALITNEIKTGPSWIGEIAGVDYYEVLLMANNYLWELDLHARNCTGDPGTYTVDIVDVEEGAYSTFMGTSAVTGELTIYEDNSYEAYVTTVDADGNSAMLISLSAWKAEATEYDVVITNAIVTENTSGYYIDMIGEWDGHTIKVEVCNELDTETIMANFFIDGGIANDGDQAEGTVEATVNEGVVTITGTFECLGSGAVYNVTISGTLPVVEKPSDPTGLENLDTTVAPAKAIVNGQLVIIKNGVQYNATGAVVK